MSPASTSSSRHSSSSPLCSTRKGAKQADAGFCRVTPVHPGETHRLIVQYED